MQESGGACVEHVERVSVYIWQHFDIIVKLYLNHGRQLQGAARAPVFARAPRIAAAHEGVNGMH